MQAKYYELPGHGSAPLPATLWRAEEPKAVLQIVHGTTEHMGRYSGLAAYLASRGITVAGFDLRGHGRRPGDHRVAALAEGDWAASIQDVRMFAAHLDREFPGVPRFLLGFSLGSFLVRDLLKAYPDESPAGAILVGTGHQPGWLLAIMRRIVLGQLKQVGYVGHSPLIRQLSFGAYNQKFKPNRTDVDWLSASETAVDDYLADPLVRRNTSAGLFYELLGSMKRHCGSGEYDSWNKNLPVLLLSGACDPVGDFGKGVGTVHRQMQKAGFRDVALRLLPGERHAVLMTGAEKILADWIISRCS